MRRLDPSDLDSVPEGDWVEVTNAGGTYLVQRVPGGWYLPGDVSVATEDLDGEVRALDLTPGQRLLAADALAEDPSPAMLLAIRAMADDR